LKGIAKLLSTPIVSAVFLLVATAAVAQPAFDVSVPSALLIDAGTGQVLLEKQPRWSVPPASLAKVMTLLVALDEVKAGRVSLDEPVRASARASRMAGSRVYLREGEVHTLLELLKAVAIAGANDAAVAVAEHIAGTEPAFVVMMNERARELGMADSRFANSHGLPPAEGEGEAYTTAHDIAIAARALIASHPEVLEWTRIRVERFRDQPLFNLYNTNNLVGRYEGLDGLRTGYLEESGYLIVATAERGGVRLLAVIMGARDEQERESQTISLLDYGFQRFIPVTIPTGRVGEARIPAGMPEWIPVEVRGPGRVLVPRGGPAEVEVEIEALPPTLPIAAGDAVGEYVIRHGERELLRLPLYAGEDVKPASWLVRLWRRIRDALGGGR
jgi:D-alanyl-D-alanine carboxypeptidase